MKHWLGELWVSLLAPAEFLELRHSLGTAWAQPRTVKWLVQSCRSWEISIQLCPEHCRQQWCFYLICEFCVCHKTECGRIKYTKEKILIHHRTHCRQWEIKTMSLVSYRSQKCCLSNGCTIWCCSSSEFWML